MGHMYTLDTALLLVAQPKHRLHSNKNALFALRTQLQSSLHFLECTQCRQFGREATLLLGVEEGGLL